ncbi:hypothetical protein HAX54_033852, partial [Datura stramonium]|nr:hypothetical protein [Datura stramonium]
GCGCSMSSSPPLLSSMSSICLFEETDLPSISSSCPATSYLCSSNGFKITIELFHVPSVTLLSLFPGLTPVTNPCEAVPE